VEKAWKAQTQYVRRWETHWGLFTSMQHEGWKEQMAIVRPYPNQKWSETRWKWSSSICAMYVKTWNSWLTLSHDYTLLHVHVCCPLCMECVWMPVRWRSGTDTGVHVYVCKSSVTPAVGKYYFVNAWRQADVYIECHN